VVEVKCEIPINMLRELLVTALLLHAAIALRPTSTHDEHFTDDGRDTDSWNTKTTKTTRTDLTKGGVNPRSKLRNDLLKGYDKVSLPVQSVKDAVDVNVGLWVTSFDLTWDGKLESNIFLLQTWQDKNLKWNPADYNGLEIISMPVDDIWQPDLFFYNNFEEPSLQNSDRLLALVYHNGSAISVPPLTLQTICKTNFTNWPYDVQTCSIQMGPWVYSNDEMAAKLSEFGPGSQGTFTVDPEAGQGRWEVVKTDAKRESNEYPCCPGKKYDKVTFTLTFKRTSCFDQGIATIPLIAVYLLVIASFLLPVGSNQRYIFHGIAVLTSLVTILAIRSNLGNAATGIPKIALLHLVNILAVAITQVISVLILTTSRSSSGAKLTALINRMVSGKGDDEHIDKLIAKEKLKEIDDTKQNVSACVTIADRFFFVAYLVSAVMTLIAFNPMQ